VNLNDIKEYNERIKREITNKIIYDYDVVKLEQISQKKNVADVATMMALLKRGRS
jgi:hypothetical protein